MSRPKLLLADDSIAIRKVVELTFADEGIEVFAVADAQAAMEKFIDVQPDIVLIDAGLEGTSGYQICEMIKTDEATQDTPVLLLVGSFEPFDHDAAERACADGVITKPFQSIRELVNRVSELLGRLDPVAEPVADAIADVATSAAVPVVDNLAEMSTAATVPAIDTADIDDLYTDSFHETVKIDEFDTLEDAFDDDGTDDELIEEVHPVQTLMMNGQADGRDTLSEAETVKEFDWSPTAKVVETEPESLGDSPKLGNVSAIESHDDAVDVGTLAAETSDVAAEMVDEGSQAEQVSDVQPNVVSTVDGDEGSLSEATELAESSDVVGEEVDQIVQPETQMAGSPEEPDTVAENIFPEVDEDSREPSAELIELITQRVVERMSDQVVREVAQESVPRIAEKLIREALSYDKKG